MILKKKKVRIAKIECENGLVRVTGTVVPIDGLLEEFSDSTLLLHGIDISESAHFKLLLKLIKHL